VSRISQGRNGLVLCILLGITGCGGGRHLARRMHRRDTDHLWLPRYTLSLPLGASTRQTWHAVRRKWCGAGSASMFITRRTTIGSW